MSSFIRLSAVAVIDQYNQVIFTDMYLVSDPVLVMICGDLVLEPLEVDSSSS